MSDPKASPPPPIAATKFPGPHVPVIFADGVSSTSWSNTVVKFYLSRLNTTVDATGGVAQDTAAQVAMPIEGFASVAVLFEMTLKQLVKEEKLTQEQVNQVRAHWET